MTAEGSFSHVCGDKTNAKLDVVFIHGLTGDPRDTWVSKQPDKEKVFWPSWLVEDIPGLCVWTAGYPASIFEKFGDKEMHLGARADHLLEHMATDGLGNRPIVFVCHSLGGIMAKAMLRAAKESTDETWNNIANELSLVAFIATPHKGATMAKVLNLLAPRVSSTFISKLSNSGGEMTELFNSYRNNANKQDIKTLSYYETHKTMKVALVVTSDSADPGHLSNVPIAIDADHAEICKPKDRNALLYRSLKRHIGSLSKATAEKKTPSSSKGVVARFFHAAVHEKPTYGASHLIVGLENTETKAVALKGLRFEVTRWLAYLDVNATETSRLTAPTVQPVVELSFLQPSSTYYCHLAGTDGADDHNEAVIIQPGRALFIRVNLFTREAATDLPELTRERFLEITGDFFFEEQPVLGVFIANIKCVAVSPNEEELDEFSFASTFGGGKAKTTFYLTRPSFIDHKVEVADASTLHELSKDCRIIGKSVSDALAISHSDYDGPGDIWENAASKHVGPLGA
ncbi:triacylglycerol lipase [Ruegeria sp. 6PALISEP08]|uniref:esterase/lipase family protein n=1 Tax=Ruegeria sp. 6PALISEP08 TaxID=1225660 RepID=UPI00067EA433|nr:hypothetical protein [Ruegeria sp. 6PALISEP08]